MGRANTRTDGHEQSGQLITAERRNEEGRRIMTKEDLRFAPRKGVVPADVRPPPPCPSHQAGPSTPLRSDIRQATHDSFTL